MACRRPPTAYAPASLRFRRRLTPSVGRTNANGPSRGRLRRGSWACSGNVVLTDRAGSGPYFGVLARRSRLLLRFHPLQPESHVHLTVQCRRDGEVLSGLLPLACAPVEHAEAEVTPRREGTRPELLGDGLSFPV